MTPEHHSLSEAVMSAITTTPRVGVWRTNADGLILESRGAALALAGLTPDEVEGTSVLDRVVRDGVEYYRWGEEVAALHNKAMARGSATEVVHVAGRVYSQTWSTWYLPDRSPGGVVAVYMDITGQRDSEVTRQLEQLRDFFPLMIRIAKAEAENAELDVETKRRILESRGKVVGRVLLGGERVVQWLGENAKAPLLLGLMVLVYALAEWFKVSDLVSKGP